MAGPFHGAVQPRCRLVVLAQSEAYDKRFVQLNLRYLWRHDRLRSAVSRFTT